VFRQVAATGPIPVCRADRANHKLDRGDWYLAIKDGMQEKKYCIDCARAILKRGQTKLAELLDRLADIESGS
jgi:hypothetical protein